MAEITLKGNTIHTSGELPAVGSTAPDFSLTGTDLSDKTMKDYKGKRIVLNVFPSLDTDICAMSVRHFNADVEKYDNTVVLCISRDLPFAHARFCTTEGLEKVIPLSEMRGTSFGDNYGLRITDGPLAGLFSRAVIVIDEGGKVTYTEQVPEIAQEPDYEAVKSHLS